MIGLADVIETTKVKLNKYTDFDIQTKNISQLAEMLAAKAVNKTIFSLETLHKKMACTCTYTPSHRTQCITTH